VARCLACWAKVRTPLNSLPLISMLPGAKFILSAGIASTAEVISRSALRSSSSRTWPTLGASAQNAAAVNSVIPSKLIAVRIISLVYHWERVAGTTMTLELSEAGPAGAGRFRRKPAGHPGRLGTGGLPHGGLRGKIQILSAHHTRFARPQGDNRFRRCCLYFADAQHGVAESFG
jgi:hypothetical protein